jgi:DNA-binding HxlR family transcriptional regulator
MPPLGGTEKMTERSPNEELAFIPSNPITRAIEVIGDRWAIVIMRELFLGNHHFNDFLANTGISKNTLSRRLMYLVEQGFIEKRSLLTPNSQPTYHLTAKGISLHAWALTLWQWEIDWYPATSHYLPPKLLHHIDGRSHILQPMVVCEHCLLEVKYRDIIRVNLASKQTKMDSQDRPLNTRRSSQWTIDKQKERAADLFGDRWIPLILGCLFIGESRFDNLQKSLTIATNILAARLSLLLECQLIEKLPISGTTNHQYLLTKKGQSLYPCVVILRQWALDYLPASHHPFTLIHSHCNKELKATVICKCCGQATSPHDVSAHINTTHSDT